jgi:hypothetical protein
MPPQSHMSVTHRKHDHSFSITQVLHVGSTTMPLVCRKCVTRKEHTHALV